MNIPYGPILIVEDVPSVLEMLAATLRFKGYPVITARNGEEALAAIQKTCVALIISDILMPVMDGFSLVYLLRKDPHTSHIPIIFLTATYLAPEDKSFALSLGAIRFLEKPIDTDTLLMNVGEVLTQEVSASATPLSESDFYQGYRQRLETKLKHKISQIEHTENLLMTLPLEQKPAFQSLLEEATTDRREIQKELDQLDSLLSSYPRKSEPS